MAVTVSGMKRKYYPIFCASFLGILFIFGLSQGADVRRTSAYERDLLNCINEHRIKNRLSPLRLDPALGRLAKIHSQRMNSSGEISHDNFDDRFRECGRACCVENVGWNHDDPVAQCKAWERSKDHDKNMLNKQIRRAGLSRAGSYVTFFACD